QSPLKVRFVRFSSVEKLTLNSPEYSWFLRLYAMFFKGSVPGPCFIFQGNLCLRPDAGFLLLASRFLLLFGLNHLSVGMVAGLANRACCVLKFTKHDCKISSSYFCSIPTAEDAPIMAHVFK
ncbi:MAG: hypothetical protein VW228_03205, partial [Pelagibacteraceae bacterium]